MPEEKRHPGETEIGLTAEEIQYLDWYRAYLQHYVNIGVLSAEIANVRLNEALGDITRGTDIRALEDYSKVWSFTTRQAEAQAKLATQRAEWEAARAELKAKPEWALTTPARLQQALAREGAFEAPEERPERRIPEMPAATAAQAYPFLEQLVGGRAGAMGRYFERRLGQMFEEAGMAEARERWWATIHAPAPERGELGETGWRGLTYGMAARPEAYDREFTAGEQAELARMGGELRRRKSTHRRKLEAWREQKKMEDPWETLLREYPYAEEFYKVPPRQRGFYPGRYAPPAVWRV